MSYVRCDGMSVPDPETDAVIQTLIGDIKRLQVAMMRGAEGSAYLRRDQGLQDLTNPGAAGAIISQIINSSGDSFQPFSGNELVATEYTSSTATHTFGPSTSFAMIQIVGAGGGGGNIPDYSNLSGSFSIIGIGGGGGGGGGGCIIMLCAVGPGESVAVAVGAGGTGSASQGVGGNSGTVSSVVYRGVTYQAGGGEGGDSCNYADSSTSSGGAGGTVPSPQAGNPFVIPIPGSAGGFGGVCGLALDATAISTLTPPYSYDYSAGGLGGRGFLSASGNSIGAGGYGYFNTPNAQLQGEDGQSGYILIREYGG